MQSRGWVKRLVPQKPVRESFPEGKNDMYALDWDLEKTQFDRVRDDVGKRREVQRGNPGIVKRGK